MKKYLVLFGLGLLFTSSCNQIGAKRFNRDEYDAIKKSEMASGIKSDELLLGYRFGMSKNEVIIVENNLLKANYIKKESGKKYLELLLGDSKVQLSYQINFNNNKLNELIISTSKSETSILHLKEFIESLYGICKYTKDDKISQYKFITHYWVKGNKEIEINSIGVSHIKLSFTDLSNPTPTKPIDTTTKWRNPNTSEFREIGKVLVNNNIRGCGEYYIVKTSSSEYLIACSSDGDNWKYYVAYTAVGKVYLASDEMLQNITPPVRKNIKHP